MSNNRETVSEFTLSSSSIPSRQQSTTSCQPRPPPPIVVTASSSRPNPVVIPSASQSQSFFTPSPSVQTSTNSTISRAPPPAQSSTVRTYSTPTPTDSQTDFTSLTPTPTPSRNQPQGRGVIARAKSWFWANWDGLLIAVLGICILIFIYVFGFGGKKVTGRESLTAATAVAYGPSGSYAWAKCPYKDASASRLQHYPDSLYQCSTSKPIRCIHLDNQFISHGLCDHGELESVASIQTALDNCEVNPIDEECEEPHSWTKTYDSEATVINAIHENILKRKLVHQSSYRYVQHSDFSHTGINKHKHILQNASYISVKFVIYPPCDKKLSYETKSAYLNYVVSDSKFKIMTLRVPFIKETHLVNRWAFTKGESHETKSSEVFVIPMESKCGGCNHCQMYTILCDNVPLFGGACHSIAPGRCSFVYREIPVKYLTRDRHVIGTKNVIVSVLLCH